MVQGCTLDGAFVTNRLHGYGRLRCTDTFFLAVADTTGGGGGGQVERPEARWQNCREYVGQFVDDKRHGVSDPTRAKDRLDMPSCRLRCVSSHT